MVNAQFAWAGVLIGGLVCARPILAADSPEQLLATARDGNRAAIQAIRTMECRYERVPWAGTSLESAKKHFWLYPGRFWRSGDTYRLFESHEQYDKVDREYVVRDGRILILRKGRSNFRPTLALDTPRPVDGTGGEVWQYLLFSHWGWEDASYYTLEEILQHDHVLRSAERLPSGEVRVELSHAGARRQEFWFDPKANYLVRKCVWVPAGDATLRWEHEVATFAEPAPGVFVPTTVENRCFVNGGQQAVVRTVITELKVNHDLPASALRLPGIAGMDCTDLNRDMAYRVDADGNRVGPERAVVVVRIAPPSDSEPYSGDSPTPLPSREPTAWWVRVLFTSALLLATGLVLGYSRRRRATQT